MTAVTNNILEKVLELFYKYGIRSVSMDDLAAELGISKKTLYQQFKDKNNLIEHVEEYIHEIRFAQFTEIKNKKLSAVVEFIELNKFMHSFISEYSRAYERDMKKYFNEFYKLRYEIRRKNIIEAIIENLNNGLKEGIYRADINVKAMANYFLSFVFFMTEYDDILDCGIGSEEYYNEVFNLHMNGILNEKGKKEFEKIKQ